ncbi:MAG: S8 family serine peptidase [Gammaproteobacteria bacterium]|nr:S8 family serine peptidase [Gammaproteobacteria bacterium]
MNTLKFLLISVALVATGAQAGQVRSLDWQAKVDASVITEATSLGQAEFLIYMSDQADVSAANDLATKEEKGTYVFQTLSTLAANTQVGVLQQIDALGLEHDAFWIVNVIWAKGGLAAIQAIAERPDVSHIYASGYGQIPAPIIESTSAKDISKMAGPEPGLVMVKAPEVWQLGFRGAGAVVGSADTGVNWDHESLKNKYRGWDENTQTVTHDYNWYVGGDPSATCAGDELNEPCDDDVFLAGGHGTHTTGTMVGDDGAGNQTGMAPDAKFMACRNLDSGIGHVPSYLRCMEFMLAPTDLLGLNPDPTKAPDVVNNSWGCIEACPPPVLKQQLENSVAAGIFYAVSAGNDGDNPVSSAPVCSSLAFPIAIYEKAFSIGATTHVSGFSSGETEDSIAKFSSRGPVIADVPNPATIGPDISAPGRAVRAASRGGINGNNNQYMTISGTSMAGPHVAGLVALVISANPDLRGQVAEIEEIIRLTAEPKFTNDGCGTDTATSRPNNTFGWGRIDALAAVQAALDVDGDGVVALHDNCTNVANPSQCDSNNDGYGNHCDADLDNNGEVNSFDLTIMRDNMGSTEHPDSDLDCNGITNSFDLSMMRSMFGNPPGPSQVAQ